MNGANTSRAKTRRKGGLLAGGTPEDRLLIVWLPVLVALVVDGWLVWRMTADLGAIETRTLAWKAMGQMLLQHLLIVAVSSVVVLGLAIPIGIALTRDHPVARACRGPAMAIANTGQSAPVVGVIVLLAMWLGFGLPAAVASLSLYAFLPVLANTIEGLLGVDPVLVEAARGMSMSPWQVLTRVELPLAVPVIMAGARTALVLLVGTAAFAAFIDAGGLGSLIQTGIMLYRFPILVTGALAIAVLALVVEWLGRIVQVALIPKGVSQ